MAQNYENLSHFKITLIKLFSKYLRILYINTFLEINYILRKDKIKISFRKCDKCKMINLNIQITFNLHLCIS